MLSPNGTAISPSSKQLGIRSGKTVGAGRKNRVLILSSKPEMAMSSWTQL